MGDLLTGPLTGQQRRFSIPHDRAGAAFAASEGVEHVGIMGHHWWSFSRKE
jgi:hypothetical protein